VVDGLSPVSEYDTALAGTVTISLQERPDVLLSMWKSLSSLLLSVHARLICEEETAVAVSPLGAVGGATGETTT